MIAFGVAASVIVLLLFGLTLAIGTARQHVLATLHANTTRIKQLTGLILLLVGLWTLALALWADTFATIFPV